MVHLFSPLSLRGVTLRNRIVVSPMCEYSSDDGFANDWHLVHLGSRAVGGAGAVLTEAAAVVPEGRISAADLGIWKDDHIDMLAKVFAFVEAQGAAPGMQLAHAGRKASTSAPWDGDAPVDPAHGGWAPIDAPSAVPFAPGYQVPRAMGDEHIRSVVSAFRDAARRVLDAGGKILEVHAAHGYLLHEFLSPLSNHRTDRYGGSFANRARIVCEVAEAVRTVWPERYPLFVRISATDWIEGGWTGDDSVALAKALKPAGVDLIDCSSGGIAKGAQIPVGAGYQVPLADRIRHESDVLTGAVGLITDPMQADAIIRNGRADVVLMARELLRDPYWPLHAAPRLHQKAPIPKQYLRAF